MPLANGSHLGPYEILDPLGAGGMGEVYRARDTRLGRDVAIKILPHHLAATDEIRARFLREAKLISGLNHPHICALHDVGRQDDRDYLVMELVEGQTLTERLGQGALPMTELLQVGIEIAEALDFAHRRGVVHRDLKPGNVMLTRSGAKLLDFGLARAVDLTAEPGGLTHSPTVSRALTAEGTLVGTFQYMAPEQLEGQDADARSDLWGLGCVLYEMATGQRAFEGKSQASLIGTIMHAEPPSVGALAPMTPPALERVVRACLAKNPEERIQTAHDLKLQLQWVAEGGSQAGLPVPVAARRRHRERLAWVLAGVLALVAAAAGSAAWTRPQVEPAAVRFTVASEPAIRSMNWPRISPDGRLLAFQASDSLGRTMVWIRPLSSLEANPLPGTEGAGRPFWSPDSRYLAYFTGTQLKKVAVAGGPPQLICEARGGSDGSWGSGGVILFDGGSGDSLRAVSASGGMPTGATSFDREKGEIQHAWPCFLPDGRHFLYTAATTGTRGDEILMVGDLESDAVVSLGPMHSRVDYTPPGYILYALDGTLMARPFAAGRLVFTGEPFPVAERVEVVSGDRANFSVSRTGILAYMTGGGGGRSELVWVDRSGRRLDSIGPPASYCDPDLSPDGMRLAYGLLDAKSNGQDIWVRDLKRGVTSRLTFGEGNEIWPVWSPDGQRIAYASDATGPFCVMAKPANGAGGEDTLYTALVAAGPFDWSRDGSKIMMGVFDAGQGDLWSLAAQGEHAAQPFLNTSFSEFSPRLSPDGRWLTYTSRESGRSEVYVQAYPGPGGKWQISTNGGSEPQWRDDGRELFYVAGGGELMAVTTDTNTNGFEAGTPEKLFEANLYEGGNLRRNRYVATGDGQRFLLNVSVDSRQESSFNVVQNWTAEIDRR